MSKWGFVPHGWTNSRIRPQNNARLETAAEKPMFRGSLSGAGGGVDGPSLQADGRWIALASQAVRSRAFFDQNIDPRPLRDAPVVQRDLQGELSKAFSAHCGDADHVAFEAGQSRLTRPILSVS